VCGCNRHGNECLVWDDASPPPGGSLLLAAGRERGRKSKSVPDMRAEAGAVTVRNGGSVSVSRHYFPLRFGLVQGRRLQQ